jgi:hypothetical protein
LLKLRWAHATVSSYIGLCLSPPVKYIAQHAMLSVDCRQLQAPRQGSCLPWLLLLDSPDQHNMDIQWQCWHLSLLRALEVLAAAAGVPASTVNASSASEAAVATTKANAAAAAVRSRPSGATCCACSSAARAGQQQG